MNLRVAIVGRGRVGGSMADALSAVGYRVDPPLGRGDNLDDIELADLVIIAVPDEELAAVVGEVLDVVDAEAILLHTCGSVGLDVLEDHGERIGVLHPAVPVASKKQSFQGAVFGVTGTPASLPTLRRIVEELGGTSIEIAEEDRVRYHAALVHVSNHLVATVADAAALLGGAESALIPLLRATVENIKAHGAAGALTGPVVRGDAETVRKHLESLPDDLRAPYRENARRALALATSSGRLRSVEAQRVADVLGDDS